MIDDAPSTLAQPAAPNAQTPLAWRGVLHPGEPILWQGAPYPAFHYRKHYTGPIFGACAVLILLFFLKDSDPWHWYAMPAFALALALGPPIRDGYKRRHSLYTLTDKRAFVGIDLALTGRRLLKHPIGRDTELEHGHSGDPDAVWFAHEMRRSKHGEYRVDIGFENLPPHQAAQVHDLILGLIDAAKDAR